MMKDTSLLFSPLLDEVGLNGNYFSPDSYEYSELQNRLQTIQRFVDSTEAALRLIVRHAASKSKSREALESILHLALDHVSLATLATLMLDDINACLSYIEEKKSHRLDDELEAELDELLGKFTRTNSVAPPEQ